MRTEGRKDRRNDGRKNRTDIYTDGLEIYIRETDCRTGVFYFIGTAPRRRKLYILLLAGCWPGRIATLFVCSTPEFWIRSQARGRARIRLSGKSGFWDDPKDLRTPDFFQYLLNLRIGIICLFNIYFLTFLKSKYIKYF